MKKGVLSGLRRTAGKGMKRLQAKAAQTADELLEKSYAGTAEQTLRGAETMTNILHEKDGTIAKAKRTIAKTKKKRRAKKPAAKKTSKKKSKRSISKRSARKVVSRKSGSR
ncbi:MAG TPA: hypothetical protein VJL90_13425 [Pseudorhodoplanes sp.]|nr:hypothetical protein [Pseudorhodoplanes sp.]